MKSKKAFELTATKLIVIILIIITIIILSVNIGKTSSYYSSQMFTINQLSYKNDCLGSGFFCERVVKNCDDIKDEKESCDDNEKVQWEAFKTLEKECWNRDNCDEKELEEWEEYLLNYVYNNEDDIIASMESLSKEEQEKFNQYGKINLDSFSLSDKKKEIVQKAYLEYEKWNYGKLKESDSKAYPYLEGYWNNVHFTSWTPTSVPWSAAFISYVIDDFSATSHSVYINNVYKNKISGWSFYEPSSKKIEIGDVVCKTRNGARFNPNEYYESHCDIVVNIENNKASLIGGNVADTVGLVSITLNEEGKIKNTQGYIGILS